MPHELIAGLEAAAVGVVVLLLVPKRGVDHIRERFADLSSGRRRWLFDRRRGSAPSDRRAPEWRSATPLTCSNSAYRYL